MHCDLNSPSEDLKPLDDLPRHADEDQVQLDVNRAFVYYPNGEMRDSVGALSMETDV